jgi:hypothetical protein
MTDRNIPTDDNLKKKEKEKKKRKSTIPPYGGSENTERIRHDISHEITFPPTYGYSSYFFVTENQYG